ncbi:MAG: fused response regulator/phosphatase [Thiovulaceae bacterium]|nr:fused response regulator/phosphatase [Sulfurimonadaceae bacterium]MCW9026595.1 fused response regulator/phosphatase [Sulfurimonadaceae bacterium]
MTNPSDKEVIYSHIKTLKILYVEDTKVTQLFFKSIVDELVNKIIYASDGKEGYQKFLDNEVDLIITDYAMPNENGLDMIEKIRKQDTEVPIILVSAIEDLNVIARALNLDVSAFIKKPISKKELLLSIEKMAKVSVANKFIEDQRNKQLLELQAKDEYKTYQEDLGFAKELNILRNDFYYQMTDYNHNVSLIDFLYHPLDVMSGDAYSARRIDKDTVLYLIVDGMGKGLSASLTSMIFISFANHMVDKMLFLDSFDMSILINETMEYIKPVLLDEESLSLDYILVNNKEEELYYAKFSMPPILLQNQINKIVKIKSNNPPLSKYSQTFNIDKIDISEITKFLIYTDGIVENETKYDNKLYSEFIEEDFLKAFTREDLKNSFMEKIDAQEDDVTLIFINKITQYSNIVAHKKFKSTLVNLDLANEWYETLWNDFTSDMKTSYQAGMVFTELFMNAHEHGNLSIDSNLKNSLMANDSYFETLAEKEKEIDKYIDVKVDKIKQGSVYYIITKITDEGNGFDTHILSEIFRNAHRFHGRGVFVSRKNSFGIYYTSKGNSVLYINKVEESSLIEDEA